MSRAPSTAVLWQHATDLFWGAVAGGFVSALTVGVLGLIGMAVASWGAVETTGFLIGGAMGVVACVAIGAYFGEYPQFRWATAVGFPLFTAAILVRAWLTAPPPDNFAYLMIGLYLAGTLAMTLGYAFRRSRSRPLVDRRVAI